MDKAQGLQQFWGSFGISAYDESSVPDRNDITYPYITYSIVDDSLGNVVNLTASIWYRSSSWAGVELKKNEIAKKLGEFGHYVISIDDGYIYMVKGIPFAQRMSDPSDDMIKRIYINVQAEFLTAY